MCEDKKILRKNDLIVIEIHVQRIMKSPDNIRVVKNFQI